MRISRKTKNLLTKIFSVVLAIGVLIGAVALVNHFVSNKADDDGLVEVNPSFEVGGLTEYGKYEETKFSIYNKESFECKDLTILLDFDSTIKYQVFFYDETDNFISSTSVYQVGATPEVPSEAKLARIEITPIWDNDVETKDQELNIFKVRKYAKQMTIKVAKEQEVKYELYEYTLSTYGYGYDCTITLPTEQASSITGMYNIGILTKEDLPEGSYILVGEGFKFRPVAWADDTTYGTYQDNITSDVGRLDLTTDYWSNYEYFTINISADGGTMSEENVKNAIQIYVPVVDED